MKPGWQEASLPIVFIVIRAAESFCAAGLFLSIQVWVSLRWRNFSRGLAVGIIAIMMVLGSAARGADSWFIKSYPWALPITAVSHLAEFYPDRWAVVLVGLIGGIIVGLAGSRDLARREW
ncbi:MAG TPA: hypothetical protein VK206_12315 [Anaerolineales bacterium]|nr:hypothetical protein [Anaerolineales bacterium]HLO33302.1 hypothetical protein [Anaerolineales bacterium]